MKTINIFTLLTALLFVMIISGCSGTKGTTGSKLEGIEWKLESLNGKTVALKSGSSITLSFDAIIILAVIQKLMRPLYSAQLAQQR